MKSPCPTPNCRSAVRAAWRPEATKTDWRTQAMTNATLSSQLAGFTADFRLQSVPEEVRTRAKHLILDALGIAIACTQWDFARITLAGLRELAGPGGDVPVIGHGESLPM